VKFTQSVTTKEKKITNKKMTSVELYKEQEQEVEASFFDDFSEGVWDALESTTVKVLFGVQFILLIAIVLVASSITHQRLLQQLITAYDDIENHKSQHHAGNNNTVAAHYESPLDQLARSIGKQLGKQLYLAVTNQQQQSLGTTVTTNDGAIIGTVPAFLQTIMLADLPGMALSVGRLLTFAQQNLNITNLYPLRLQALEQMAQIQCNFSQGPVYYNPQQGQGQCAGKLGLNACCGCDPVTNWEWCNYNYNTGNCGYCQNWWFYNWYPTPAENRAVNVISTLKSFTALFWYQDRLKLPFHIAPPQNVAFAPLQITKVIDFLAAQGQLDPWHTVGTLPCNSFIASLDNLNLSGEFIDGNGVKRTYNVNSTIRQIVSVLRKVCGVAANMPTGLPTFVTTVSDPGVQQQVHQPKMILQNSFASQQNGTQQPKRSALPNFSADSSSKFQIITFVFAGIIVVLSIVLLVILVKSVFGWAFCSEKSNEENEEDEQNDEEEDLVFELFHRRRNQVLLLINCILILVIALAAVSAVSYKQYLDDVEHFVHLQAQKSPEELGVELGKAIVKMFNTPKQSSATGSPSSVNADPEDNPNDVFGLPIMSVPVFLQTFMLQFNYPAMAFNVARFSSRMDANVIQLCNKYNNQIRPSICFNGVDKALHSMFGTIFNSISPNLVFGSYKGNVATDVTIQSQSAVADMFNPITALWWITNNLSPNGQFSALNQADCQNFTHSLEAVSWFGSFWDANNGVIRNWDWRSTVNSIGGAMSHICNAADTADGGSPFNPNPNPSPNNNNNQAAPSSSVAEIVGGAVGGVAFLGLLGFLVFFFLIKKKNPSNGNDDDQPNLGSTRRSAARFLADGNGVMTQEQLHTPREKYGTTTSNQEEI
jgi:heme/copper-type cytochrome/quinol oxidase subunit 2